jgi:phage-related protein (TIGR01555 family)
MIDSINQYLKTNNLIFEVLDEFKVDVYKMKNLANTLLAATGTQTVRNRVAMANQLKNYNHAIVMDSEDDFIQKELTFAGIAETMDGIRKQVASDLRMPLTKLFGISAAGFNSGEDDIEVYNAMIESQIRSFAKKDLLRMVQLRCQQQYGMIPTDLCIEFEPLRVLSAEQEENVKTQKFNRLLAAKTSGEISSLEFRDACNKDSLLSIQLNTDEQTLALIDEEKDAQADQENEEGAPKSKGKEGSSQEADEVKQAKT